MNYSLGNQSFDKLCPFYMIVNHAMEIQEYGHALKKLCPELAENDSLEAHFEVEKNPQTLREGHIVIRAEVLYFFKIQESGIKLKGQFIAINESYFLFVGAPLIAAMKNLTKVGLNFMDFPLHDYFTDAIFLLRANEKTMMEVQEYSRKIKSRNQELLAKTDELEQTQVLLRDANENLESKVRARTRELEDTLVSLQQTQDQLIESEKLAALGQLVAGIAHEINTPIGAIKASVGLLHQSIGESLSFYTDLFETVGKEELALLGKLLTEIFNSNATYSSREQRILNRELKARLLEEGIAETRNIVLAMDSASFYEDLTPYYPLFKHPEAASIANSIRSIAMQDRMTGIVETSVRKADKVVSALKTYMDYQDESEVEEVNIVESIESVLVLYKNLIKLGVEVDKTFSSDEMLIECFPNQLNQVWVNLIFNALQAMENRGNLTIHASHFDDLLFVKIEDSGPGIPFENQARIFDPFYTTKKEGEGTGLGLNLVKKIVRKHQGDISLESEPGKTTFTISLPGVKIKPQMSKNPEKELEITN